MISSAISWFDCTFGLFKESARPRSSLPRLRDDDLSRGIAAAPAGVGGAAAAANVAGTAAAAVTGVAAVIAAFRSATVDEAAGAGEERGVANGVGGTEVGVAVVDAGSATSTFAVAKAGDALSRI